MSDLNVKRNSQMRARQRSGSVIGHRPIVAVMRPRTTTYLAENLDRPKFGLSMSGDIPLLSGERSLTGSPRKSIVASPILGHHSIVGSPRDRASPRNPEPYLAEQDAAAESSNSASSLLHPTKNKSSSPPSSSSSSSKRPPVEYEDFNVPLLPIRVCKNVRTHVADRWLLGGMALCWTRPQLLLDAFPGGDTARVRIFQGGQAHHYDVGRALPWQGKRPLFCHAAPPVLWAPMLEKAFALRYGRGYAALEGGSLATAVTDICNRPVHVMRLHDDAVRKRMIDNSLWRQFDAEQRPVALCARTTGSTVKANAGRGLYTLSAYPITRIQRLPDGCYALQLLDIWGSPWRGRFSKQWADWTTELRELLKPLPGEQGQPLIWMHSDDASITFNTAFQVWLSAEHSQEHRGSWARSEGGNTAGGSLTHSETVANNPQYQLVVPEDNTELLITLTQPDVREQFSPPVYSASIGVYLLRCDGPEGIFPAVTIREGDVLHCSGFYSARDVSTVVTLDAGRYIVMPATHKAHKRSPYTLAAYSDQQFTLKPMDQVDRQSAVHQGNWQNNSRGGITHRGWHEQAQFQIRVGDTTRVQLVLHNHSNAVIPMELFVFESERHVVYPHRLIAETGIIRSNRIALTLDVVYNRTYAVLPCTTEKLGFADFSLSLVAAKDVPLHVSRMRSVWKHREVKSRWSEHSAGGCHNNGEQTWSRNPHSSLFVAEDCEAVVVLRVTSQDVAPGGVGVYCLRGRPPITLEKLCGASRFVEGHYVATSFLLSPGDYTLVPCTFHPGILANYEMEIYLDGDGHFI